MSDPLHPWTLSLARERPDLLIPGSPERCIARRVVQDADGGLWVLERIAAGQAARREALGRLLAALAGAGLARVCAYRACGTDEYVHRDEAGGAWQLAPFIPGEALDAPDYAERDLPGEELADVLLELRAAARRAAEAGSLPAAVGEFALAPYVERLLADLGNHAPEIFPRASDAARRLTPFLDLEPSLPRVLCHGDLHPLNAIWRGGRIRAIIDWEFAGFKHALYDMANTLGCLGIENPATFQRGAGAAMLRRLKDGGLLPPDLAPLLRPAIAASRFGWLAEWVRKDDAEMAEMELAYLELLTR